MKIALFDAKPYDKPGFEKYGEEKLILDTIHRDSAKTAQEGQIEIYKRAGGTSVTVTVTEDNGELTAALDIEKRNSHNQGAKSW